MHIVHRTNPPTMMIRRSTIPHPSWVGGRWNFGIPLSHKNQISIFHLPNLSAGSRYSYFVSSLLFYPSRKCCKLQMEISMRDPAVSIGDRAVGGSDGRLVHTPYSINDSISSRRRHRPFGSLFIVFPRICSGAFRLRKVIPSSLMPYAHICPIRISTTATASYAPFCMCFFFI